MKTITVHSGSACGAAAEAAGPAPLAFGAGRPDAASRQTHESNIMARV